MELPAFVHIDPEVRDAIASGIPVVALETAILTHGMPAPVNVETALLLERTVREGGAVPATIGVIDGVLVVGLGPSGIARLAASAHPFKAASFDLAWAIAAGRDAGTTVSATVAASAFCGIRVFATGGIGGVHRGAERTFDESNDLMALAATPVIVVSAGCKSVLDVPKTLERLETLGVPVVGFRCGEFPTFFSRGSGLSLGLSADGPDVVARMFRTGRALGRPGGILVANPIPAAFEIPRDRVDAWMSAALAEVEADGVAGKDVTPRLLDALNRRSCGATLLANVELVRNNASVAAQIAYALTS